MLQAFRSLFIGGDLGYGEWDMKHGAVTRHGPVPLSAYEKHLAGKLGLGLVPVRNDGTCRFAAVDIDDDHIDHKKLVEKVKQRRFPLHVCRSKSGGAHLYLFFEEPGFSAVQVRALLSRWAAVLGFPSAEIFPKQVSLSPENVGNWINLPYFGADTTTRYEVRGNGAVKLNDFLGKIQYYDPKLEVDESVDAAAAQMPPCLVALSKLKLKEGDGRNNVLFNAAVYFRKAKPAEWEEQTSRYNSSVFKTPLTYRELQAVMKSAGRVRYQYTCDQQPIKGHCNRELCQTLKFGVNNLPWKEQGTFDPFEVSGLRKLTTTPPRYILTVSGRDLELSAEEFTVFTHLRKKILQSFDLMVAPMKQAQWDQQIRELMVKKENIVAPDDASITGLVVDRFHEFLSLRERATSKEDLLRGLPVQQGEFVLFRMADFRRHLQTFKLDKLDGSEIFLLLKSTGCAHQRVRMSGKLMTVWAYPVKNTNDQTEDFEIPTFSSDGEPL